MKEQLIKDHVLWIWATILGLLSVCCPISITHAQDTLLSPDAAFSFSVESISAHEAQLKWDIQPNYYLYQHKFEVRQDGQLLPLKLPPAQQQYDENYGHSQVYFQHVEFQLPTQAAKNYVVTWQGCAKDRICYPPQNIHFQTDADGLVSLENNALNKKRLLDLHITDTATSSFSTTTETSKSDQSVGYAQDQTWSEKLQQHSLWYSILLFFGLGVLLAFTPCSLPMLPILTSLVVRENKGVKAWVVASSFVLSMALVYAGMGLVAASAGLNFQRWLQQPATLITFSFLFVLFALNLFGFFEIKLPQAWVNRLDQWQSLQRGGTIFGAAFMGVISALLVGPCMTAPLAGILLFISQNQNLWQGALLLFCLGLGMGFPLLLASVLGAKVLPKAGDWMNQIKVIFAFIMLALSIYFLRPLLSQEWFIVLSCVIGLIFMGYALKQFLHYTQRIQRALYAVLMLLVLSYLAIQPYQYWMNRDMSQTQHIAQWHVAQTAQQFQQLLAQAPPNKKIIIDVYADWCVACQPIEHRILKHPEVNRTLQPYYLIKLDLSHYDDSHEALLKQWGILGPPTYLFLSQTQQEYRHLRLTGVFTQQDLLQQLNLFEKN